MHNGKEIKKLDGGNCRTANIVYAARCKIQDDIYIGNTEEELRERFSKHRYDTKNRPDNNELAAHIRKHQHELDKDIEVFILKGNLHLKHERFIGRQIHLFIGHKSAYGTQYRIKTLRT